jgi:hypothetical protein
VVEKATKDAMRCKNNDVTGTVGFFSPSMFLAGGFQISGGASNVEVAAAVAPRADLFALGLILVQVFTGDKLMSALPVSLAADPMTTQEVIAAGRGGRIYAVMQNTALAREWLARWPCFFRAPRRQCAASPASPPTISCAPPVLRLAPLRLYRRH